MAKSIIEIFTMLEPVMGSKPAQALINYIEKIKSGVAVPIQETLELYDLIKLSLKPETSKMLIAYLHQQKSE